MTHQIVSALGLYGLFQYATILATAWGLIGCYVVEGTRLNHLPGAIHDARMSAVAGVCVLVIIPPFTVSGQFAPTSAGQTALELGVICGLVPALLAVYASMIFVINDPDLEVWGRQLWEQPVEVGA